MIILIAKRNLVGPQPVRIRSTVRNPKDIDTVVEDGNLGRGAEM